MGLRVVVAPSPAFMSVHNRLPELHLPHTHTVNRNKYIHMRECISNILSTHETHKTAETFEEGLYIVPCAVAS